MQNNLIIGRVVKDLELRTIKTEKGDYSVVTVTIAEGKGDDTVFLPIEVWGNMAENASKYLKKGQQVAYKYKISPNNYKDKDDKMHYDWKFTAIEQEFLGSKQ